MENGLSDKQERQLKYLYQRDRPGFIYSVHCEDCDIFLSGTDHHKDKITNFMNHHPRHNVRLRPIAASADDQAVVLTIRQALNRIVFLGRHLANLAKENPSKWNPILAQARHAYKCINGYHKTITQPEVDHILDTLQSLLDDEGMVL